MTQNVGRLGVVLGIDTAQFVQGLNQAKQSITQFAVTNMPRLAAAGAAAFAAMTYKALQFADQMSDVAKANDVAIETVLQLGQALTFSGGKASDASKLFASFSAQIDSAAEGSKTAQTTFERIGISLNDLAKLSTEDLFDKVIQQLAQIDDAITRNALAVSIFGKAMKGVDIRELAERTKEGREEFKKYADAVREAGELNDKLEASINKLTLSFTKNVVPTITRIYEELGKSGGMMESVFKGVDYFISHTAFGFKFLVGVIESTFQAFKYLGLYLNDLLSLEFGKAGKRFDEYLDKTKEIENEVKGFGQRLFAPPPMPKAAGTPPGRNVIDADAEAIKKAQELSAEFGRQQALKYEQLQRQTQLIEMTEKERQIAEAIFAIEDERKKKIFDIDKKITEERAKARPSEAIIRSLEEEKNAVNALSDAYKTLTEAEIKSQQERQNEFVYGWEQAYKRYVEESQNYAKLGEQAFSSVVSNMDTALSKFVETGKFNFKSLAQSIIQDLIRIQLRMQMMQLFGMGKGFLSDIFGFGKQVPAPISDATIAYAADGGFVNSPTIVGENGPELFIPQSPGTIVPNQQLSNVMGNQPQIVYNGPYIENMSAIDTQSATQFLAANKQAVYAANLSATRSLPASR